MAEFRIEKDSMGEVKVPAQAYYGAQTLRAVENFPISGQPLPARLVRALGQVKIAAALANKELGLLKPHIADAICAAAAEIVAGKWDKEFPIDVYQTGSGTSSNMNANEVISNRAIEMTGGDRFQKAKSIHPNDHVNMGQSTNDMFPTAIHVAAGLAIRMELLPALGRFGAVLDEKAKKWDGVLKIGRTHLADATPIRLGQEFSGYARQLELSCASETCTGGRARTAGRRHCGRHRNQYASGVRQACGELPTERYRRTFCGSRQSFRSQRQSRRFGGVQRATSQHRHNAFQHRQ